MRSFVGMTSEVMPVKKKKKFWVRNTTKTILVFPWLLLAAFEGGGCE